MKNPGLDNTFVFPKITKILCNTDNRCFQLWISCLTYNYYLKNKLKVKIGFLGLKAYYVTFILPLFRETSEVINYFKSWSVL